MNLTALERKLPEFLLPAPDSMIGQLRRCGEKARYQALNLLWSVWVFAAPLFTEVGSEYWWSLLVSYPVFVLLFALVHVRPQREANWYVAGLTVLAGSSMLWNPSAWTYAVFACVYVGFDGSLRRSLGQIVLIELLMTLEMVILGWPWWVTGIMLAVCTSSGVGSLMGRVNWRKNAELRMSNEEVRRLAATSERERIGRDLHDLLGHTLSLITLKLELSRKLFDRDRDAARRELEEAESVARHALAEVRSAVTGIRAAGLAAELASAKLLLHSSQVEFDYEQHAVQLPALTEGALALVLREAVTNIHRHARATHAEAIIRTEGDDTVLCIRDNGRGGVATESSVGNGLSGMRERVRALHGRVEIDSPPGVGTTLRVWVPMSPSREPDAATRRTWAGKPGSPSEPNHELAGSRA